MSDPTITPDPRLEQVVHFANGRAVMLPGSHATPEGQRIHKLQQALSDHTRRDADLRASMNRMLDSEVEERRRGNSAVLAQEVETAAKALDEARWTHRMAMSSASAIKPGAAVDGHTFAIDKEIRDAFRAMSIAERQQVTARALGDPLMKLRQVEALVRGAEALDGLLPPGFVQTVQAKLLARLRPGDFAALDVRAAQINALHAAVSITVELLAQHGVNVVRDTPTAHKLFSDPEHSTPLRWTAPEVDPRYAPEESAIDEYGPRTSSNA